MFVLMNPFHNVFQQLYCNSIIFLYFNLKENAMYIYNTILYSILPWQYI